MLLQVVKQQISFLAMQRGWGIPDLASAWSRSFSQVEASRLEIVGFQHL